MGGRRIKRVFLTGASAGIGLATAKALTEAGCEVWGTSRSLSRLPGDLDHFHPVQMDLEKESEIRENFARAQTDAGGHFDVLINNAGSGWFGPASAMPTDALLAQFWQLTFSPMILMQLALPAMRKEPGGLVVNVTSLAARLPLPFSAAYSAAKGALSVLTATMQMEEDGAYPVTFVDVQPGDIGTGFNDAMKIDADLEPAAANRVQIALAANNHSMKNAPDPKVVADRIVRIVRMGSLARLVTVGNFWQAGLGPLAARCLPSRLLQWTIRKNFGL